MLNEPLTPVDAIQNVDTVSATPTLFGNVRLIGVATPNGLNGFEAGTVRGSGATEPAPGLNTFVVLLIEAGPCNCTFSSRLTQKPAYASVSSSSLKVPRTFPFRRVTAGVREVPAATL